MVSHKFTAWLPTLFIFSAGMLIWGGSLLSLYAIG